MPQTTFKHGAPTFIDYTPGGAVTAGDVVTVGDVVMIAHQAIAASDLGALAIGGGVYEATFAEPVAQGKKVYWDESADKVTGLLTGNILLGICTKAATAVDGTGNFLHVAQVDPDVTHTSASASATPSAT